MVIDFTIVSVTAQKSSIATLVYLYRFIDTKDRNLKIEQLNLVSIKSLGACNFQAPRSWVGWFLVSFGGGTAPTKHHFYSSTIE